MNKFFRLSAVFLVISGTFLQVRTAQAFETQVLQSVVSVLPNWLRWKQDKTGKARRPKAPEGSAVAIFPEGYLITNSHVLGNAKETDIRLADGRLIAAKIIGRDLRTDLALLKVPHDFPILKPAPSPEPGSPVCTVGNQFGLGLSVTCGVVSAVHRTGTGFNPVEDFIQTDAAVNPGGSGGALVDDKGRLVGVVAAIFTKDSDSNIGINFATSIDLVKRVASDLRDHGRVQWANSGFRIGALNIEQRRQWSGGKVIHIVPGGAAEKAGIKFGDIITKIGSRRITRPADVASALAAYRSGEQVNAIYLRKGKIHQISLLLN